FVCYSQSHFSSVCSSQKRYHLPNRRRREKGRLAGAPRQSLLLHNSTQLLQHIVAILFYLFLCV
ncbi:hypothetical protein GBAR_LOCUS7516, partial [Geodia barretti]